MDYSQTAGQGYDSIRTSDAVIQRLQVNHPTLIDLTTGRVERLLAALDRPDLKLPPVLHVAGTNGKGSTVAYMRAIAEAAGLTTHVLTSPHLVRFAERIRIAGKLITDDELSVLIDRVEATNAGEPISFFEITTVLAFLAFAETPADLCIVEVGLGGRFDATNIFTKPAVSVITPIDYDHLELLGPELSKIAWEKAGIIKAGCPVVVARQHEESLQVIEQEATEKGAEVHLMGRDFDVKEENERLWMRVGDRSLRLSKPSLLGGHQFENAGLAVAAMLTFDPSLSDEVLSAGVSSAVWPARMQRLTDGPLGALAEVRGAELWLDGGHNPHAGKALAEAVYQMNVAEKRPLVLVVGMFARKDAKGFLLPFLPLDPRVITTTFASPSAASGDDLRAAADAVGLQSETAHDVTEAVTRALDASGPAPRILICGGLHFAGEVLLMSEETWPT